MRRIMSHSTDHAMKSRFWRGAAVAIIVILACDVGLRLLDRFAPGGLPDLMPSAYAGGGIINAPLEGIVTTNEAGTIVYKWGRVEGRPGGMSVIKFDVKEQTIERIDLK